jgi:FKBP-type peptidyl-prolyl cis-trans isomerase (trigger factor)
MDAHLAGMSEGETKEFDTTIPEDYGNAELAGKEAHYVVTLKGVKHHELPELDDEFAKSAGEYESLDGLRAAIREQLATRRQSNAERDFRENLLKAITDGSEVEIHHAQVHQEADSMMREMQRMVQQSGLSWDQFLAAGNKTAEEYHDSLEPEAQERVKRKLVLDAIADAEQIGASEDEIEQYLQLLNMVSNGKPLRVRQLSAGQRQFIIESIRRDKAITLLVERAGGDEMAVSGESESGDEGPAVDATATQANAAQAARAGAELSAKSAAPDPETVADGAAGEQAAVGESEVSAAGEPSGAERSVEASSAEEGAGATSGTSA